MKYFLLLLSSCFLVAACNRPMLQPPYAHTPTVKLVTDTKAASTQAPPVTTLRDTPTATDPQIMAITTQPPTNSPTLWPSATLKPTPYPTPAWCPIEPAKHTAPGKLRLVYVSQGDLWLADENVSLKQLSSSGDIKQVSLSDDGQIIAFTRQIDRNQEELWGINADGSNERRLLSSDELTKLDGSTGSLGTVPWGFQWEPRSHHLAFYTYPIYDGIWIFEPSIPWLADMDTGEIYAAPYHGGQITYSPNGKLAIIYSKVGISLVNIDGSNLRQNILPAYHGIGEGESYYHPQPFWASDSASFMVAIPDQDDLYNNLGTVTIWRVPVDGAPEKLGQFRAFTPSVQFSPDRSYMSYWLWPQPAKNMRELHITQFQGIKPDPFYDSIYTSGDLISELTWSPDSQHFIFQMGDPDRPTSYFFTGDICHQPKKRTDSSYGGIATWVDSTRLLLEIHLEISTDSWELRLGKLDQEQTELIGIVSAYDWAILP